jgi:hypothetical protein
VSSSGVSSRHFFLHRPRLNLVSLAERADIAEMSVPQSIGHEQQQQQAVQPLPRDQVSIL